MTWLSVALDEDAIYINCVCGENVGLSQEAAEHSAYLSKIIATSYFCRMIVLPVKAANVRLIAAMVEEGDNFLHNLCSDGLVSLYQDARELEMNMDFQARIILALLQFSPETALRMLNCFCHCHTVDFQSLMRAIVERNKDILMHAMISHPGVSQDLFKNHQLENLFRIV